MPVVPFGDEQGQAIDPAVYSADALRRRFRMPPRWTPEVLEDRPFEIAPTLRPAAVLIAFLDRADGVSMLLTRRSEQLLLHRGQIAFPGGRVDPGDASPIAAALRETHEEVGIDPSKVEVLGTLPEYLTGSGYRITPVVGLIDPAPSLSDLLIEPAEVAEVFEVPARFLMNPSNHQRRLASWVEGGVTASRSFLAMPWQVDRARGATQGMSTQGMSTQGMSTRRADEYFIWGATAAMLRNLYRFLAA